MIITREQRAVPQVPPAPSGPACALPSPTRPDRPDQLQPAANEGKKRAGLPDDPRLPRVEHKAAGTRAQLRAWVQQAACQARRCGASHSGIFVDACMNHLARGAGRDALAAFTDVASLRAFVVACLEDAGVDTLLNVREVAWAEALCDRLAMHVARDMGITALQRHAAERLHQGSTILRALAHDAATRQWLVHALRHHDEASARALLAACGLGDLDLADVRSSPPEAAEADLAQRAAQANNHVARLIREVELGHPALDPFALLPDLVPTCVQWQALGLAPVAHPNAIEPRNALQALFVQGAERLRPRSPGWLQHAAVFAAGAATLTFSGGYALLVAALSAAGGGLEQVAAIDRLRALQHAGQRSRADIRQHEALALASVAANVALGYAGARVASALSHFASDEGGLVLGGLAGVTAGVLASAADGMMRATRTAPNANHAPANRAAELARHTGLHALREHPDARDSLRAAFERICGPASSPLRHLGLEAVLDAYLLVHGGEVPARCSQRNLAKHFAGFCARARAEW